MLRENLQSRPNVFQVLKEACAMQGREVPISDVSNLILGDSGSQSDGLGDLPRTETIITAPERTSINQKSAASAAQNWCSFLPTCRRDANLADCCTHEERSPHKLSWLRKDFPTT